MRGKATARRRRGVATVPAVQAAPTGCAARSADAPRLRPAARRRLRAAPGITLSAPLAAALVVIAVLAPGLPRPSSAAFNAATANGATSVTADTLDPPTALAATAGGTVSLSWTATPDAYASGHRILRATTSGGPYTQIAQIAPRTTTTYVDNPPSGATVYYYVARAYAGGWESANSNQVTATVTATGLATGDSWQIGLTHTAGTGPSRALVLVASNEQQTTSTPTLTGVTFGGRPLTQVTTRQVTSAGITALIEIWVLDEANLAAATSSTIVPTWTAAPDTPLYAHAVFANVNQTTMIGATTFATVTSETPNPVPMAPVATAARDTVIGAATAGESGAYTAQNGFTLGQTQSTTSGGTTSMGAAHKAATGADETVSMPFNSASPPSINRQIVLAMVLKVRP